MKHDILIFDLDGTISDPKDGVVKSINYALEYFNFEPKGANEIAKHIGPPLDVAFKLLANCDNENTITSLIKKYRERYSDVGYSENVLYDGIRDSLISLHKEQNCRLAICTSKRVDFATKILEMFGLSELFEFIDGGDVGIEKHQQLKMLLEKNKITKRSLMIGDRFIDLTAAHINNLSSAGVLWGYGSKDEIQKEKPMYIFSSPEKILRLNA